MTFKQHRSDMVNRLDNVTVRAAVFCINLNLFNRCLGRPYNKVWGAILDIIANL